MALDPRLVFNINNAPVTETFKNTLLNIGEQQRQEQSAELQPFRSQLLQAQAQSAGAAASGQRETQREQSLVDLSSQIKPMLDSGDTTGAMQLLESRIEGLRRNNIPTADSEELLNMVISNPLQAMDSVNAAVELGRQKGLLGRQIGQTSGQRDRQSLINDLQGAIDSSGKLIDKKDMTAIQQNAAIALDLLAPVRESSLERIVTDPDLTKRVTDFEGGKASVIEGSKQEQKLKFLPKIARAVKLEEKKAIDRGDTLSALNRSRAALPGLTDAVDQLRELSKIATSTFGGKLFNAAVKETGFGSTKGATARAKFIAIINNQVLPLLKETFGAAFTFQEGESLKATMGDPDASPEEKMAQLDAFISQKQRDIQTKELQLGQTQLPVDQGGLSPEEQAELDALKAEFGVQ